MPRKIGSKENQIVWQSGDSKERKKQSLLKNQSLGSYSMMFAEGLELKERVNVLEARVGGSVKRKSSER